MQVAFDWAPMYELLSSLEAFLGGANQRILDSGTAWIREARQALLEPIDPLTARDKLDLLCLLVSLAPGERTVPSFQEWLQEQSAADLYGLLRPKLESDALPEDLDGFRNEAVALIARWNDAYFNGVDPAILEGLQTELSARRHLDLASEAAIEAATNGVQLGADDVFSYVLLVPQHHFRPWNVFHKYRGMMLIEYPADALPVRPGEPSVQLLRLTRALADESRLRILHLLAAGPKTFSDIVHDIGLAKSTVHHHLVLLRAAGLVRVRGIPDKMQTYSLRSEAIERLGTELRGFLGAGGIDAQAQ